MLGRGGHADKRIATTVAFILKCPASTVPQAMRACNFSDKESKHAGMQMAVRRARDKALAGKKRHPPPSVIISASRSGKKNREVDMSETYLGRYAALQRRNAVAAVLDFTNDEWDSLKRLREADSNNIDLADDNGCNVGALGAENGANGGELVEEAV